MRAVWMLSATQALCMSGSFLFVLLGGIIGTHLAIANIGRLYIYGPPGVMLLRQRHGAEWMLRPAFTWGFSFYLTEFTIPGWEGQNAQLFVNVTKVWTEGDQRNGIDMVGLSLTFK